MKGRIPQPPPIESTPIEQLGIMALTGGIDFDIEGPFSLKMIDLMVKRLSGFLTSRIIKEEPKTSQSAPYLLSFFYNEISSSLPNPSIGRRGDILRTSCTVNLLSYTSGSCVPISLDPSEIAVESMWELVGFGPYPLIVTCKGFIKLEVAPINKRDLFRERGLCPIPLPTSKWNVKSKTLIHNLSQGVLESISVEETWPIRRRPKRSLSLSMFRGKSGDSS